MSPTTRKVALVRGRMAGSAGGRRATPQEVIQTAARRAQALLRRDTGTEIRLAAHLSQGGSGRPRPGHEELGTAPVSCQCPRGQLCLMKSAIACTVPGLLLLSRDCLTHPLPYGCGSATPLCNESMPRPLLLSRDCVTEPRLSRNGCRAAQVCAGTLTPYMEGVFGGISKEQIRRAEQSARGDFLALTPDAPLCTTAGPSAQWPGGPSQPRFPVGWKLTNLFTRPSRPAHARCA